MKTTKTGSGTQPIRLENLEAFCIRAMRCAGMDEQDAQTTARVLVTTDSWGTFTHGTKQLRGLLKNFRDSRMHVDAHAELISEGPGWVAYDGRHSMPQVSSVQAVSAIISKAAVVGIAVATIRNSGHYGAAGYYANLAAEQGMIGLSMTNVDPGVAAPGSRGPVLGTNPIAYAVPASCEHPLLFDIATSVVAASKVYALKDEGKSIPEGWLIDKNGMPTTDPTRYPLEGALLPMAAHKGYGIAVMVEVLTGLLAGGAIGSQVVSWVLSSPQAVNQSHSFIVINPDVFMPRSTFVARVDEFVRQIKNAPKALGTERIFLPGEMEWEHRERVLQDGLVLPDHVMASLRGLAQDYGMDIGELSHDCMGQGGKV